MKVLEKTKDKNGLLFLTIFIVFLILRLFAWRNTFLFEDTDSLFYLDNIKTYLTFNLKNIINLDADSTPFYPFFGALFSLPGWSIETGARFCSLFFSSIVFVSIIGIGGQIAKSSEVAFGLLILSFSPVLISLSFSILSEPSYMAIIYFGFWLFWLQYRNPEIWKGGILGFIFGLSFLNRVEGILYLGIIPLFQGVHFFWGGNKNYNFKRLFGWTILFIVCFSLMAAPQIFRVSNKMGQFAINGRQAWSVFVNYPDGRSEKEKIFGLDYSPSQINITYIKSHPEVLDKFKTDMSFKQYIKIFVINFNELYHKNLGILIGPLGFIFFGFGLLALYQAKRHYEIFLIIAFISFNLSLPLLHNVIIRHIAIIAPMIMLIEGIGIVYLSNKLLNNYNSSSLLKCILPLLLFISLLMPLSLPFYNTFNPPHYNQEYSPDELKEPIVIIKKVTEEEALQTPVIASERAYLAYFTGGKQIWLPYTNYEGLLNYCNLNNVDFLYLKHTRVSTYPFFELFSKERTSEDFRLLYKGVDPLNGKVELYRFKKKA